MPRLNNLTIMNARITFKNFSGAPGRFNPAGGVRSFHVVLDPEMAQNLAADGWNVKPHPPKDEYQEILYTLPVAVSYRLYPPKIVLVTSNGKTVLNEDELHILDFAELVSVDLLINPSSYDFEGRKGIKAYLKTLYATMYEDELEKKYMDVPDTAKNSIMPNEV